VTVSKYKTPEVAPVGVVGTVEGPDLGPGAAIA
jgi:hypothetical protein